MQIQGTIDIPIDVCVNILEKSKLNSLIGDDVLDMFIIMHVNVNIEEMMYCLVKHKRLQSLKLYIATHVEKIQCISSQCLKNMLELSIKQRTFTITILLCKAFIHRLDEVAYKVIKSVVNGYIKALQEKVHKEQLDCIICMCHKAFLEYFLCLCRIEGVMNHKLIRQCDFTRWLVHKHSHSVIDILLKNDCLTHIFETLAQCALGRHSVRTINAIIGSNNVLLMNALIAQGYQVLVCDVIVGIAMSNYEMLKYMFKYFKPRWYSKKFRGILLSIAFKRDDEKVYQLVKAKLEG